MLLIYKYDLPTGYGCTIKMSKGAQVLCLQIQGHTPRIWALVNPDEKRIEDRTFRIFGTGHSIPNDKSLRYIGTYQELGGALVWQDGLRSKTSDVFEGLSVAP